MLLDVGVLRREDEGYRMVRSLPEVEVPDTIQGIITSRLDHLGEAGKYTVQLASVIGRQFRVRLLARLVDRSGSLKDAWRSCKHSRSSIGSGSSPSPPMCSNTP